METPSFYRRTKRPQEFSTDVLAPVQGRTTGGLVGAGVNTSGTAVCLFHLAGALLNGIVTGMIYALLGIGLSLILGLLNIPNFAQGVMYALGGYFLFTVAQAWLGFWGGVLIAPLGSQP